MKNLILAFTLLLSTAFISCDRSSTATTEMTDSIEVVTDSVASDSILVDSISVDTVAIDTVA